MNIKIPKNASDIIRKLEENGYKAYVVGGCVRDSILGKEPNDWDICTSAKPEEVMKVFSNEKIVPTGLQHGTVTIVKPEYPDDQFKFEGYEVTTFREDGDYSDGRHPDDVSFVTNVTQDLARRDFTINAIAYSPSEGIVDPFGGMEDLRNKILRCVGNAEDRFAEDALRIMRALRFAANYGLVIDKNTADAADRATETLNKISKERITTEMIKMFSKAEQPAKILGEHKNIIKTIIPELAKTDGFNQQTPWHQFDVFQHTLKAIDAVDYNKLHGEQLATVRFAALFHDIGKPDTFSWDEKNQMGHFFSHAMKSVEIADKSISDNFRMTSEMKQNILILIEEHENKRPDTAPAARRLINKVGAEDAKLLMELQKADILAHGDLGYTYNMKLKKELDIVQGLEKTIDNVISGGSVTSTKQLDIRGKDLIDAGYKPGPAFSQVLTELLNEVMDEKLPNLKDVLLERAEEIFADISELERNVLNLEQEKTEEDALYRYLEKQWDNMHNDEELETE